MDQSAEIDQLTVALLAVQNALEPVTKTKTAKVELKSGGSYSYNYADLEACVSASRPLLVANGLVVVQPPDGAGLTTQVMHTSGQWLRATMDLHPSSSPQGQGSGITYGRRYAWCSTLGLLADEDDDGGTATNARALASSQPPPQGQQAPQEPPFQGQRPPQAQAAQQQPQGQAQGQQAKKRGNYSWCNGGSPPGLDEKANKPSKGQSGRLFAIARDKGFDHTGPLVAAMFNGLREDAMDWKQITYLSDAIEDGWQPQPLADGQFQGEEPF